MIDTSWSILKGLNRNIFFKLPISFLVKIIKVFIILYNNGSYLKEIKYGIFFCVIEPQVGYVASDKLSLMREKESADDDDDFTYKGMRMINVLPTQQEKRVDCVC